MHISSKREAHSSLVYWDDQPLLPSMQQAVVQGPRSCHRLGPVGESEAVPNTQLEGHAAVNESSMKRNSLVCCCVSTS